MKYTGLLKRIFGGDSEELPEDTSSEQQIVEDEYELAAVIAAAVQEYMQTLPGTRLEIVSIRRTGQTVPVWSRAGRLERISGKL